MSYTGETIDIHVTLRRLNQAARNSRFISETLVEQNGLVVPVLTRSAKGRDAKRIYLSAGMHGDEPAGPLAVLELLESESLSNRIDWTILPVINPAGIKLNQRENHQGIDLNRDYKEPQTKEVKAHRAYIEASEVWDLALSIHEDWESDGFYLYNIQTALTDGWSEAIIETVSRVCPIDRGDNIDEMEASGGIITPDFDILDDHPRLMGKWPEPVYMHLAEKTRGTYTFEAPSSFDLATRISALKVAILKSAELLIAS